MARFGSRSNTWPALCVLAAALLVGCGGPAANSPAGASTVPPASHTDAAAPSAPAASVAPTASPAATGSAASVRASAVAASPAPARPPLPKELVIPAIKVDAVVEQVGKTPDGAMDVPRQWEDVGWFDLGYRPGEKGSAVVAGHLDSTTGRAVFWDLNKLKPADKVLVKTEGGAQMTFQVIGSEVYPFDRAPIDRIFGPADPPMLNLVTCNGVFDRGTMNYDKRLVVYTRLVS